MCCLSSRLSLSVGFSIQNEAMDVTRLLHYQADVTSLVAGCLKTLNAFDESSQPLFYGDVRVSSRRHASTTTSTTANHLPGRTWCTSHWGGVCLVGRIRPCEGRLSGPPRRGCDHDPDHNNNNNNNNNVYRTRVKRWSPVSQDIDYVPSYLQNHFINDNYPSLMEPKIYPKKIKKQLKVTRPFLIQIAVSKACETYHYYKHFTVDFNVPVLDPFSTCTMKQGMFSVYCLWF